jgi:ppGpp synthetase/RelA/SpoT-type nucleotidyltranferase
VAEVSARPKDPVSFAAKLIAKDKYTDPFKQLTDFVGVRVVVHLTSEVDEVCQWIERAFEVDRANSGDKLNDLGTDRFGYRSVHYVIEITRNMPSDKDLPAELIRLKAKLVGLKAEIQVRTIAQHAWSAIGHDRIYKAAFQIPDYWKREANRISALLEAADEELARLVKGLSAYKGHIRHFPNDEAARRQIALWDVVRRTLPDRPEPTLRVAQVALERQDWAKVIEVMKEFKGVPTAELLSAQGYARCKKAKNEYADEWMEGIAALEKAAKLAIQKVQPLLRLGELYSPLKRERAMEYYEQAFVRDPSDPGVLVGYIRSKALESKDTSFIPLLRPDIEQAIKRCEELAAAEADLPRTFYRIAGFRLLLGARHANESLAMLARAVHWTNPKAPEPLLQALKDVSELAHLDPARPDIECARRFLAAAVLAKCSDAKWPADVAKPAMEPLPAGSRVVIVAGGCDASHDLAMRSYAGLLEKAFANFEGIVISGGTAQGISGVVGELARKSKGRIRAIGYLPASLPTDGSATMDDKHYTLRRTDGGPEFTAREPIQNWLDLLATGIKPQVVRLLGVNGGNIAGLEYRLAVALGACVGVIEGSGREAERVAGDWPAIRREESSGKLLVLPTDAMTLRAFLGPSDAAKCELPRIAIEEAAKLSHQMFLEEQRYKNPDPVMKPWPVLRGDIKQSNLDQITYLVSILRSEGFDVRPLAGIPNDPKFTGNEVQRMGEMEHGRWNAERLYSGWRYSKQRDAAKKLSPYLVPWKALDPSIRKYDLRNVRRWPQVLAEVGYEIYRCSDKASQNKSSGKFPN